MALRLHSTQASVACRAVLLVAAQLDVPLEVVPVDLRAGEQLTPQFLAMNPQHCVPTLQEGDFILWESRAICTYLASKQQSALYPPDLRQRATIDRLLDFDLGTLHYIFAKTYRSVIEGKQEAPHAEDLKKLDEALELLEKFLSNSTFVAGKQLSVADCCLVATVSTCEAVNHNMKKFVKVAAWLEKCKQTLKGYEKYNTPGLDMIKTFSEMQKKSRKNKTATSSQ
ncbi:glutathione S-transferase 1 [Hyalella azteca]|uniref:Glutathione S-transferase 1 n=1 Tax=Hyalella azteca TaxID=294128 RepID=A0A8B7NIS0_HYAAZ|nr:glutathione S-transferase 1 [Hyalella azteca]